MRFSKKILLLLFLLLLLPVTAFAVGKVLAPVNNQSALPIGGRASNGDIVPINVDSLGDLIFSSSVPIPVSSNANQKLYNYDSLTGVTALNADTTGLALSSTHLEGAKAVSFNKSGSSATTGAAVYTFSSPLDLAGYDEGNISFYIYFPTLTNVGQAIVVLGSSTSNLYGWSVNVSSLTTGWNKISLPINSPSLILGTGLDWSNVSVAGAGVAMLSSANTISGVIVDAISIDIPQPIVSKNPLKIADSNGATIAIGQKAMANSVPVVLPSDQSSIPVTGTVSVSAPNTFNVSQSSSLEASRLVKNSAGKFYKMTGRIDATASTGTYYIQIIDSASVPANGAVTLLMAPLKINFTAGTDSYFDVDLVGESSTSGIAFSSGCVVVVSTTEFSKTIALSNLMTTSVFYK